MRPDKNWRSPWFLDQRKAEPLAFPSAEARFHVDKFDDIASRYFSDCRTHRCGEIHRAALSTTSSNSRCEVHRLDNKALASWNRIYS
jgi:hypothetical protein